MKKGLFIVFEGPEGSGKSTQVKLLKDYFEKKGYKVLVTREPGGTKIAESVRKIILSPRMKISPLTELLLYEASRAQHTAEIIVPNLEKNKVVISDRFADASIVYQGYGRGLNIDLIKQLNNIATMGIKPDITFLLDINPEEGLTRVMSGRNRFDRLEREDIEFHRKIRNGYLSLAKSRRDISIIKVVKKTKELIHSEIVNILKNKFKFLR